MTFVLIFIMKMCNKFYKITFDYVILTLEWVTEFFGMVRVTNLWRMNVILQLPLL